MSLIEKDPSSTKDAFLVFIILIFAAAIIAFGFIVFQKSRDFKPDKTIIDESQPLVNEQSEQKEVIREEENKFTFADIEGEEFEIILETNSQDDEKTDIYIRNTETDKITFLITLDLVQRNIKNGVQHVNGKLYVIRRRDYDGYPDEDWIDELWVYTGPNSYQKVYSSKGLTSMVNPYNNYIAVNSNSEGIAILNPRYQVIQKLSREGVAIDLSTPDERMICQTSLHQWNENDLWLTNSITVNLIGLTKINALTGAITKYPFEHNSAINRETAINLDAKKIAYSDFPVFFGAGDYENFTKTDKEVTLYLYDFITHERSTIDTSIVKLFKPEWINDNTLKYNDPERSDAKILFKL